MKRNQIFGHFYGNPHYLFITYMVKYSSCVSLMFLANGFALAATGDGVTTAKARYGSVIANTLHVRAKPGEKYEVVCRLADGDEVEVRQVNGDWLGIVAPKQAEAWVAVNQISQDETIFDNVPVYAGPGTIFSSYHRLNRGEKIHVIRTSGSQWARIRPLSDFIVWVHGNYIKLASNSTYSATKEPPQESVEHADTLLSGGLTEEAAELSEKELSGEEKQLVHAILPLPIDRKIVLVGQREPIQRKGTVVALDKTSFPFKYALAKKINSTYYPLAYLSPEYDKLKEWAGKVVTISGFQSWIRGWPRPMIQVEMIDPLEKKK